MTTARRGGPVRSAVGALVLALALALACAGLSGLIGQDESVPTGLVIVTLDTTRADRLSPYGYMNVSLPALERLAREGVVFEQATSVAPLTLPAHASLFTGLIPPRHGVRDNGDAALADAQTTLAELLAASGYMTGAFVGSVVLAPDRGLRQGFDAYEGVASPDPLLARAGQRRADAVVDDAIEWLERIGDERPFFLWAHLYDAHRPYDPPEPYRAAYGHNPYVGEIAFADAQVGRLIDALERRGRLDRTVVVVTGDHGEALGSHGEEDHGIFIYEEVLRVPLVVRAPGLPPGRVPELVRLIDVMPTALNLLGVPAPARDGVSLVSLMRGDVRDLQLEGYAESLYPERFGWSPLRSLRSGRFKLIDAPRAELYDLERDPFEERNLYQERRTLARAMTARLASLAGLEAGSSAGSATIEPAPELRERLAALGYLAANRSDLATRGVAGPDPKDCIGVLGGRATSDAPAVCRRSLASPVPRAAPPAPADGRMRRARRSP